MIREGVWLMVIGMSGVFVFLLLLVGLMQASGRVWVVLDRWLPPPSPSPVTSAGHASASAGSTASELDEERARIALVVALARAEQDRARAAQGGSPAVGGGRA